MRGTPGTVNFTGTQSPGVGLLVARSSLGVFCAGVFVRDLKQGHPDYKATGGYPGVTEVKYNPKDAMYQYHLGHARFEVGKLDQARLALEESVKQNKRLYKAHFYLGKIHAAQERPKDAAAAWTESCRLNPGFGKPFYELGKLYFEWDHNQEAIQVLVQGAQNARDSEDLTDIYHQLGMAYDALKQYDKSIESYTKALEARKDNLEARFQLGMAYAAKGDKGNARKFLEEFVKQGGAGNTFLIQAANDRLLKLTGE